MFNRNLSAVDSAKYLKELEEEAARNYVGRFVTSPNSIVNGAVLAYQNPYTFHVTMRGIFTLNGKEYRFDAPAQSGVDWKFDAIKAMELLYKKVSETIAAMLLTSQSAVAALIELRGDFK